MAIYPLHVSPLYVIRMFLYVPALQTCFHEYLLCIILPKYTFRIDNN